MTDITEKLIVAVSAFVIVFALGAQGFHSHRIPSVEAQTDLGPDTSPEDSIALLKRRPAS